MPYTDLRGNGQEATKLFDKKMAIIRDFEQEIAVLTLALNRAVTHIDIDPQGTGMELPSECKVCDKLKTCELDMCADIFIDRAREELAKEAADAKRPKGGK